MAFGSNPTTSTQGSLPANQFPLSSVATPDTANGDLTALEGGPISTDGNSNKTAPASVYLKDGRNLTEGAKADAAITDSTTTNTKMAFLKGLVKILADIWDSPNHRIKVDGSGVTQPVSASSLPLPSGAATSAKQPALGTAGSASADVITVQGISSMTALKVDGSAITQPVSGTITANAGSGTFPNQQSNVQADYDSGAGTQNMTMFGMALPASGGSVPGGTSSNPLRTDPTGTTIQPVSAAALPLPSGASTEATLGAAKTDLDSLVAALGAISDSAWALSGNGDAIAILKKIALLLNATLAISGSVTANAGTNLNTSALALETGGNLATLAGIVASNRAKTAIDSITASLTQANQVPVSPASPSGQLSITETSLTANSDNTVTFSATARRIRIQNESSTTIYWKDGATASNGSASLAAPVANAVMVEWVNVQCSVLHIFVPSGGTTVLNGNGGVKVSAWA